MAAYESWRVVAQPEKTQVLAITRKLIKNARVFFMAWLVAETRWADKFSRRLSRC